MTTESKKQPRATKRRTVLERNRAEVAAILATGEPHAEVARIFGVERSSVLRFQERHIEAIQLMAAELERQVTDALLAHKVNRIWDAQADYDRLGDIIDARSKDTRYDEPGYATGLMAHTLRQIGTGKTAEIVDEFKVDTALVAERRTLRRAVAEELDHLPRGANVSVNVQQNFVRYIIGADPEIELG